VIEWPRRHFLLGAAGLVCAPAVIRVAKLMSIKSFLQEDLGVMAPTPTLALAEGPATSTWYRVEYVPSGPIVMWGLSQLPDVARAV
jgi:hypothetical protein